MLNEPTKYGINFSLLADSQKGFVWNLEIYHRKNDNVDNTEAAVVVRLLDSLQGKGHTLTNSTLASI